MKSKRKRLNWDSLCGIGSIRTLQFGAHLRKANKATKKTEMKMPSIHLWCGVFVCSFVDSRYDICFLSNFPFFFSNDSRTVSKWCTSQSHLGEWRQFFHCYHKTKNCLFKTVEEAQICEEMQKTAFTNFTGHWRLNTWWTRIERSYSTGNCTLENSKNMQFKW